jgi:hypothetical protein
MRHRTELNLMRQSGVQARLQAGEQVNELTAGDAPVVALDTAEPR